MKQSNTRLSENTKKYLCRFQEILDTMMEKMTCAPLGDSISDNFIVQMIPHHKAAIEMSKNLLCYTTFVPLQNIAENIIASQTKSIEAMQDAQNSCGVSSNSPQELHLYQSRYAQITRRMFSRMQNAPYCNDINTAFMLEMIPHHEGAISMSKSALDYPICPELVPILDDIITSQTQGVQKMQRLLRCRQS